MRGAGVPASTASRRGGGRVSLRTAGRMPRRRRRGRRGDPGADGDGERGRGERDQAASAHRPSPARPSARSRYPVAHTVTAKSSLAVAFSRDRGSFGRRVDDSPRAPGPARHPVRGRHLSGDRDQSRRPEAPPKPERRLDVPIERRRPPPVGPKRNPLCRSNRSRGHVDSVEVTRHSRPVGMDQPPALVA